ncbi:hypothetical protein [Rhodanobacter lindaniclasticus]
MAIADQDCPLPQLAGPALKVLRAALYGQRRRQHCALQVTRSLAPDDGWHWSVTLPDGNRWESSAGHPTLSACIGHVSSAGASSLAAADRRWRHDHDLAVASHDNLRAHPDSATLTALIAELRARETLGRAKYGTDVDRTDLTASQWRQHLREELMDALLYSLAEERTAALPPLTAEDC